MKTTRLIGKAASGLVLLAALAACSKSIELATPQEPGNDTVCSLDGMVLRDHPGPKAQMQYAEGTPEFFCDLMELFATVLTPEQKRGVASIHVQDMGKTAWENPQGNWIDARTAIYVIGSKKNGSMGPALGSFSSMQDAETFVKNEGGKIVRFAEITTDMLNQPSGANDSKMH